MAARAASLQPQPRHLPCSGFTGDCGSWCRRSRALPQAALNLAVPRVGHRKQQVQVRSLIRTASLVC